jgi:hypothetical protein
MKVRHNPLIEFKIKCRDWYFVEVHVGLILGIYKLYISAVKMKLQNNCG